MRKTETNRKRGTVGFGKTFGEHSYNNRPFVPETTFLLRPSDDVEESMKAVLRCLFWRVPELSEPAMKFLEFVKANRGADVSTWEQFCREASITRGQYDSIIRKLRGSGLIYKREETWMLSYDFVGFLQAVLQIAEHWMLEDEPYAD